MTLPNDPVILLSFVNTKLRDEFPSLSELAKAYGVEESFIVEKLAFLDYKYDEKTNQFVQNFTQKGSTLNALTFVVQFRYASFLFINISS